MKNYITPDQTAPVIILQENSAKQDSRLDSSTNSDAKTAELEMELRKQKAAAEKGAKLMQLMWGDKFQSDSLY
jgi:hypothetical protein